MYDIRFMYPAAMTGLMTCGEMTFFDVLHYVPDKLIIATVSFYKSVNKSVCLDSTFDVIPCIYDSNTIFACAGHITAVMTSVEIQNAKLDGLRVTDVRNVVMWNDKVTIFNVYRQLYDTKQKHQRDTPLYWFFKIVMNVSCRKFA